MKRYRDIHGQEIGALWNDGVFRKVISLSQHRFKSQDALGMDKDVLYDLPSGTEIRIKDTDEDTIYVTTSDTFKTGQEADFSHGVQILLWRGLFDQIINKELTPSPYLKDWIAQVWLWESRT